MVIDKKNIRFPRNRCLQSSELVHFDTFSMRATVMNRRIYMLNAMIKLQSSGWTPYDCKTAAVLAGQKSIKY